MEGRGENNLEKKNKNLRESERVTLQELLEGWESGKFLKDWKSLKDWEFLKVWEFLRV